MDEAARRDGLAVVAEAGAEVVSAAVAAAAVVSAAGAAAAVVSVGGGGGRAAAGRADVARVIFAATPSKSSTIRTWISSGITWTTGRRSSGTGRAATARNTSAGSPLPSSAPGQWPCCRTRRSIHAHGELPANVAPRRECLRGSTPQRSPSLCRADRVARARRFAKRVAVIRVGHNRATATGLWDVIRSYGRRGNRYRGEQRTPPATGRVSAISSCSNDHTARPVHAT